MGSQAAALNVSGQYRKIARANDAGTFDNEPKTAEHHAVEVAFEHDMPASRQRVCDTVRIRSAFAEANVHLVDGKVAWVAARSLGGARVPRSFFARLMEDGGVTRQEVDSVMSVCRAEGLNFCEMLVQLDMVEAPLLRELFRAHVTDHIRSFLASPHLDAAWQRTRATFTGELTVELADVLEPDELQRWRDVVSNADGHPERREAERHNTAGARNVVAHVKTKTGALDLAVEDLSHSGALIVTPEVIPRGTSLEISLRVGDKVLELACTVVRVRRRNEEVPLAVGVAWSSMTAATRLALIRAIASLK